MAARTLTRKQLIINAMFDLLKNSVDVDDQSRVWNTTPQNNLSSVDALELPAATIYEGEERAINVQYPCVYKVAMIFVEFRFEPKIGVDVYDLFRYYVGIIITALMADVTLGGLADNLLEVHNEPQIVDRHDPRPGGVMVFELHYRHNQSNPYSRT